MNSNHNDGDSDNHISEPVSYVSPNIFSPVVTFDSLLNKESHEEHKHSDGGTDHTDLSNVSSDLLEFLLKWCLLGAFLL